MIGVYAILVQMCLVLTDNACVCVFGAKTCFWLNHKQKLKIKLIITMQSIDNAKCNFFPHFSDIFRNSSFGEIVIIFMYNVLTNTNIPCDVPQ